MISKNYVKAAARALDVFEAFGACQRPLTLTELAGRIEVPASSCFALIQTFVARGYLRSGERRTYYPTRRMLANMQAIVAGDPLSEGLSAALVRLRDATGETVILGKRQGDEVLYLEVAESAQTVRYTTSIGVLKPLHSSAMGKAFLGSMGEEELAELLANLPLPAITPHTLTSPAALGADIAEGRARGWYTTRGENVDDVMAFALTHAVGGEEVGITVAGPVHRMERDGEGHVVALLRIRNELREA
jgi:DNA-binding IclR family transcriptional regulator